MANDADPPVIENPENTPKWVKSALFIVNLVLFVIYWLGLTAAVAIVYIYPRPRGSGLSLLLNQHFAAIVGLPAAALMAFCVVSAFRATEGPIELNVWGLKLSGASGPVVLWVVTFLAVSLAVRTLW